MRRPLGIGSCAIELSQLKQDVGATQIHARQADHIGGRFDDGHGAIGGFKRDGQLAAGLGERALLQGQRGKA